MIDERYKRLFEPVNIGPVIAPNRFYAAPHATGHGWNQPQGAIALRAMKAEGGWGTVAVQMTEIAADTDMANHPMERIWDDSDIPRHAAQVAAIKKHGSLAAIELAHGGMRARNITSALPVIGPSSLPVLRPEVPAQARAMRLSDIKTFRESHKAAARRAKLAGYDILYVYAAHDLSLLNHFLSVRTNLRSDEYGGSLTNRLRLIREVLEDTLEIASGEQAVALRFSVAEPGKPDGLTHDGEGRDVVEALAELPDLWDVNLSGWSSDSASARFSDEGFQLPYTDFVKSVTSKPVVGVGRFTSPDLMVSLIKNGRLDLIGAARPSIADPFLPNKIKQGAVENIRECIGCNICISMDSYGLPLRCTQNPTISEEWRRGWHPEAPAISHQRQSHLIIGAGPAGLECAVTLLKAKHKVTVADAADIAGGRSRREAILPGLSTWGRVADYRLHQLSQSADADVYLSSVMSAEEVLEFGADTVTLATGATWRRDGVGSSNSKPLALINRTVLTPDDVMDGTLNDIPPSEFIVYDDEHFYMASVIANSLAADGHRVSLVCPLPAIATWTEHTLDQAQILRQLQMLGVSLYPNTTMTADGEFFDLLNQLTLQLPGKQLVLVGARTASDTLYFDLMKTAPSCAVHLAGDCLVPGTMQAAVLSGHTIARKILAERSEFRREQIVIEATP